ncbi:unnamed protein product, partial [Ectocarpus fasciculatus]
RNCVARLWWSRHAGENAETMTWEAFEEAFQSDFGAQLPKTLDVLRKHIAVQGDDYRPAPVPPTALPPPPPPLRNHRPTTTTTTTTTTTSPRARRTRESTPARSPQNDALPAATDVTAAAAAASGGAPGAASSAGESPSPPSSRHHRSPSGRCARSSGSVTLDTPANGGGVGGGAQARIGERVVINVETGEEELQPQEEEVDGTVAAAVARAGEWGALERGFSRLLSSVRREREGAGLGRGATGDTHAAASVGGSGEEETSAAWRVTASLYEEVTWAHGGLYEAFQALADPRRVVFAMGVVDDGPHHEVGEGGEGWSDVSPVVVQGLLGLSVQQVC